jgi:hypothetical protein
VGLASRDFRRRLHESQILTLTKETVDDYSLLCNVEKPSVDVQRYAGQVFGNTSLLDGFCGKMPTGSFCKENSAAMGLSPGWY